MKHNYFFKLFIVMAFFAFSKVNAQITTYPYVQDFGSSSCTLPAGYTNTGSDPWDFQNTSETYMEGLDHTSNGGCFASMDDSGGSADDSCLLTTPTFDLTSMPTPQLRFWWQNSNSTTSTPHTTGPRPWSNFYVDISTNGGTTWTRNVWMVEDSQQIGWAEAIVNLTSYKSTSTVIRFRGLETQSFRSDLSLDDILIYQPQAWDAELSSIDAPGVLGCGDTMATVSVTIKNNGSNAIPALPVYYQVGTGTPVMDTVTNTIASGASVSFTFTVPISGIAQGSHSLKAWTDLPFDSTYSNDTAFSGFSRPPTVTSYPYLEDFENGQGGWQAIGATSSWAFGTPAKATIVGASSGVNAFVTGGLGTTQYNAGEASEVLSPCFDFTSAQGDLWVTLDVWWNAEMSWDGAVLQYSIDSGATWLNVGAFGDPNNWYTDNTINGNPGGQQEGWSGRASSSNGSGGWVFAKHVLPASLKGKPNVMFRVAFGSDTSVQDDGFAFDDFTIVDYSKVELDSHQTIFCGDSSAVDLVLTTSGVTSWGTYEWNTSDSTDTLHVTAPGMYSIKFTDTLLSLSNTKATTIMLFDLPAVGFVSKLDTILTTETITLDPVTVPGVALSYSWSPGGDTTETLLVDGAVQGTGSHQFIVTVTDSIGCSNMDSAVVVVIDITGIGELDNAKIQLFPNPVSDFLNVQLQGLGEEQVQLELYGMNGQLIFSDNTNSSSKSNFTIDMSNLESGTYMFVLSSGGERLVQPVIKK